MKFLVIGLGSMGKRRIRCLISLGIPKEQIHGIDPRKDRCSESETKYGISTSTSTDKVDMKSFDAYIISSPPNMHNTYCQLAVNLEKPAFVEASVIKEHVAEIIRYNVEKNVFIAPSCTLLFHPTIKNIREIIGSGKYGKITNFTYHSGQYLPDWHPWEKVTDFYVSKRETGGGREIVPFELTWLIEVIGKPDQIKGYFEKTIDFGVDIEDTYSFVLKYPDKIGAVTVDVASRFAVRNLIINLENAQIQWQWNDGFFKLYEADNKRWITYYQPEGNAVSGYNKNIIEEMYIEEIQSFLNGIKNPDAYPNSLKNDLYILELLEKIEQSDGGFKS